MTHAQELNQIMAEINDDDLTDREKTLVCRAIMETLSVLPRDSMQVNGVITRLTNQVSMLVADSWRKRGRVHTGQCPTELATKKSAGVVGSW